MTPNRIRQVGVMLQSALMFAQTVLGAGIISGAANIKLLAAIIVLLNGAQGAVLFYANASSAQSQQ